jgi:hypothetical protein
MSKNCETLVKTERLLADVSKLVILGEKRRIRQ